MAMAAKFSNQTSMLRGVAADRSRRAQQPVGRGLEGSGGTTQAFLSGWKKGRGLAWCAPHPLLFVVISRK